MSTIDFKRKATSGMIWTAIQKYSNMSIYLISGIILARLLEPEDYGCIGMLAIFISLAEICIDAGFGSALIQKKKPTQTDYSTIFFFNLGMSSVMYMVLFFCAPLIAKFYHMPLLSSVLRVQGLILFIYALSLIQANQLRKQLNFKQIAIATTMASVIGLVVTIYMAYNNYGVWSLVAQYLIVAAVPMIIYWFTTKWRPALKFSWKSVRELFGFGGYMLLSNMLNRVSGQINGLLIGRLYNPATMGFFSKAQSTEYMADSSISGIMTQVTYPLYAAKQDNREELVNIIKRISMTISYFTTPLMALLCLVAKPLFVLLYSEKWLPSVPYFQLLCLAGIAVCLHSINNQALAAIGKSKLMFKWTVFKKIVEISLIVVGLFGGGIYGLLIAMIIDNWFIYFVNAYNVSKHIGYPFIKQIWNLSPVFCTSAISYTIAYLLINFLHLSLYIDGLLKAIIFITIYCGWSFFFKPEAYTYSLSIFQTVLKKK